jgi:hypothetical protein
LVAFYYHNGSRLLPTLPSEGYLKHEGMRLPYGYNTKDQTDLLGPLWGCLRKNVGTPWDLVYADICRNLDFRSVLRARA